MGLEKEPVWGVVIGSGDNEWVKLKDSLKLYVTVFLLSLTATRLKSEKIICPVPKIN